MIETQTNSRDSYKKNIHIYIWKLLTNLETTKVFGQFFFEKIHMTI